MVVVEDDDVPAWLGCSRHVPQRGVGMGEPLENAPSGDDVECPLKREGLDVGELERESGDVAVRAPRLFDQPGINIDAEDAARRRHGFGDAARNSSRATAGVEHRESRPE